MTWTKPSLTVEVTNYMVGDSLTTDPDSCTSWIDLSDRVISFNMERGRQDRLAEFETGTCSVVLNNDDRMCDPSWASSLVAGCQYGVNHIRVRCIYNGTTYELFTGYIGPESWQLDAYGNGAISTATINAYDRMGLLAQWPLATSPFDALVRYLNPDERWRGEADVSILSDNDTFNNSGRSGTAYGAYLKDNGGGQHGYITDSITTEDSNPAVLLQSGARFSAALATLFPSGAISSYTAMCVFKASTAGSDQSVMRLNGLLDGSGNNRWQVYIDTAGAVKLRVYDNSGSVVDTQTVPANAASGSGGRWDDDVAHLCIVRVKTGTPEVKVWIDNQTTESVSGSIPNPYSTGALLVGSTAAGMTVAEMSFWRSALASGWPTTLDRVFRGQGPPFEGDSLLDRVTTVHLVAGFPFGASDAAQVHTAGADPTLWGMGSVVNMESTVADQIRQTVAAYNGAAYCTRAGRLRARTYGALTDIAYAANYATPQANLTNEVSPAGSPTPIRRGPISFSGYRQDRVVNKINLSVGYDGGGATPQAILKFVRKSITSIGTYGVKSEDWTTTIQDDAYAVTLADARVDERKDAIREIGEVSLDVWGYDDTATFVLGLELENAVTVTDVFPHGSTFTGDFRVIHESWDWTDGTAWTVTLNLAEIP